MTAHSSRDLAGSALGLAGEPAPVAAEERSRRKPRTVAAVADIPPGSMLLVPEGPFGIGIYNIDGTFHAVANYCPHEGAPVCLGRVHGSNVYDEEGKQFVRVLEGRVLRCPWHQWEFDLVTGKSLAKPERRVKTYQVAVVDEKVVVYL